MRLGASIFAISLTNSKVRGLGASFLGVGMALSAFLRSERSALTCFSAFLRSASLEKPVERVGRLVELLEAAGSLVFFLGAIFEL